MALTAYLCHSMRQAGGSGGNSPKSPGTPREGVEPGMPIIPRERNLSTLSIKEDVVMDDIEPAAGADIDNGSDFEEKCAEEERRLRRTSMNGSQAALKESDALTHTVVKSFTTGDYFGEQVSGSESKSELRSDERLGPF